MAILLLAFAHGPLGAQQFRLLAFGDSITQGYGDSGTEPEGYPGRLQRWLRDLGYDATVPNFGVGGETTVAALSRIDSVLLTGGHFLLLMEGTNDISAGISIETIRFNLDTMARRAENAGMVAVHATVIPRVPWATIDSNNSTTDTLARSIRNLASLRGRLLVDQFALFQSLPNVYVNYYLNDPEDPVGHPNSAGYTELAGNFLESLLPLLQAPRLEILPPSGPVLAGTEVTFGAALYGHFSRLRWSFGDSGFSTSVPPHPASVRYLYLTPGSYSVTLEGTSFDGRVATDVKTLQVGGSTQVWFARSALLASVLTLATGSTTDVTSQIRLQNFGSGPAMTELTFFPDIRYDAPPVSRRYYLRSGTDLAIPKALEALFGLKSARGSLLAWHLAPSTGALDQMLASAEISHVSSTGASSPAVVEELRSTGWSSGNKVLQNVTLEPGSDLFLVTTNLDVEGGYLSLELRDANATLVGNALFEVAPLQARWRSLRDLFRGLEGSPQPLRLTLRSSGPRFAAFGILSDPLAGLVLPHPPAP